VIRKRPGMYIGRTGEKGLQTCVMEITARACQQYLRGRCHRIEVVLHRDNSISIKDDGEIDGFKRVSKYKLPLIELELSSLHWATDRLASHCHFGANGVGPICVNALSEWMLVRGFRRNALQEIRFCRGKLLRPLQTQRRSRRGAKRWTALRFKPDPQIFGNVTVNFERLARRLRQITALSPGLEIRLREQRPGRAAKSLHYVYNNGLVELLNEGPPVGELVHESPLTIVAEKDGVSMELAMQYENSINCRVLSFVNLEITKWGSIEMAALLAGLADAINAPCQFEHEPFSADFVRHGLNCILSIKMPNPKYYAATKERLLNPKVYNLVRSTTCKTLKRLFAANPKLQFSILRHLDDLAWANQQLNEMNPGRNQP
jgi:DNA gyrase subunit B